MPYQISITICEELTDEEFDSAYYALCEFLNETIGDDWGMSGKKVKEE